MSIRISQFIPRPFLLGVHMFVLDIRVSISASKGNSNSGIYRHMRRSKREKNGC